MAEADGAINLPARFNATTYFVDRHLEQGRGDDIALVYRGQELTYRCVAAQINRTGNALRELGVGMEDRVMLLLLTCPEFAYTFFGAMKIGAVPAPLSIRLVPEEYRPFLDDSRARVLVVSHELLPLVRPILPALGFLEHVVVVGGPSEYPSWQMLVAQQPASLDPAPTHRDDVAFWAYTSGTTGISRAAVHLQRDLVFSSELCARQVLDLRPSDRVMGLVPLFFSYSFVCVLHYPWSVGAAAALYNGPPDPRGMLAALRESRATIVCATPPLYAAMLAAADATETLPALRVAISCGEPLPPLTYQRWRDRFGIEIQDGLGSNEVCAFAIANRRWEIRPGSTGRLLPGFAARLVDEEGAPVPPGDVGILMIKSPTNLASYWHQAERSRQTIQGEWVRTGDTFAQDADGYFWPKGRADDLLKLGGFWVSPTEIERVLLSHPAVRECAVVAAPAEGNLIRPRAFVIPAEGTEEGIISDMQDFARRHLPPQLAFLLHPLSIELIEELPRTPTGKIHRSGLRRQAKPPTCPTPAAE